MSQRSTLLLEHHLKELRLPSFLREYGKLAAQCAAENADHPEYLLRLAELELIDRHQRMVERRIRAARFPAVKSFDSFDFPAIPSVNKALVMELARCEYVQRRENVIAVGNSGTGKTHVAQVFDVNYLCRFRRLFLPVHLLLLTPLLSHSGSVAGHVEFQDDRVMHDAVDGRRGGHGIGEDVLPLGEDQVGGDAQGPAFVALGDESEEHLGLFGSLGQVSQVVQQQEVVAVEAA